MSKLVELPEDHYSDVAFSDFEPAAAFHHATARALSWVCQLAYESNAAKIARIAARWGVDRVQPFQQDADRLMSLSASRGLLIERGAILIVAFTGTDPAVVPNLITDLDARRSPAGLHSGFEMAAAAIWDVVAPTLMAARDAGRPVVITGHSLGGALAIVTAHRALHELALTPAAIYTYGMPRVGDAQFAQSFNRALGVTTYRMVYGTDVVPTLPGQSLGFSHVGRRLHCARAGRFDAAAIENEPGGEEPGSANGVLSSFMDGVRRLFAGPLSPTVRTDLLGILYRRLPPGVADHLPDRYFTALG